MCSPLDLGLLPSLPAVPCKLPSPSCAAHDRKLAPAGCNIDIPSPPFRHAILALPLQPPCNLATAQGFQVHQLSAMPPSPLDRLPDELLARILECVGIGGW